MKLEFVKPNQTYVIDTEQTSPEKLYDEIHQDVYDYVEEFIIYGDKEVFSVINHNTDKHYTICFTNRIDKVLIGEADDSEKLEINAE